MSFTSHSFPEDPVDRAIARARGVLPDQGPIGVFIHHNTLHAYQYLPFHEAVQTGASALGARPYLSQREFRDEVRKGRIADADVREEISRALGERGRESVMPGLTRAELWHLLMVSDSDEDDAAGLEFAIGAGVASECRDLPLWEACVARVARGPAFAPPDTRVFRRHRDVLCALGAPDTDVAVHGELIRLGSGFLDQGQAHAVVPERDRGFLHAVTTVYLQGASAPRDCRGAEADMRAVAQKKESATSIIRASLDALGVHGDDREPFLFATALALPGWAGMFSRLEMHPEDNHGGPPVSLEEFLAIRLLLERRAIERACNMVGMPVEWSALRASIPPLPPRPAVLDTALLWGVANAAEISPGMVATMSDEALATLWQECVECSDIARRCVFQEAYERTYRRRILDAMAARRALPTDAYQDRPRAQFVFCIDEREESIRRAVEEQGPDYITFGMAGFFGVAIDYLGLYDREPAAHCPVVVTPAHEVHEQPVYTDLRRHLLSRRWRDRWLTFERRAMSASRTMSGGLGASFLIGPLSGVKTLARVVDDPRR
jgi:uncharacterized protein YbcC (UPF0753/DUF2309 family)